MNADPFDLDRFLPASDGMYAHALAEIRAGRKQRHWMWFIFPQLKGLGQSERARHFGLSGLDEAAAYLAHPVLGPRLIGISQALMAHEGTPPEAIFGEVDAMKLRACATLFSRVKGADPVFKRLLDAFFDSAPCPLTEEALAQA